GQSGADRLERLLHKPVFRSWRDAAGDEGVRFALDERLDVIEGDLGQDGIELPGDLHAVLHCAATVSFDPPVDEAFTINLLGPVKLYEAVRASAARPHLVHVST